MGQCPTQGHRAGGRRLLIPAVLNLNLGFSLGVDEKHASSHWIAQCYMQIFTSNSVQEAKYNGFCKKESICISIEYSDLERNRLGKCTRG